jgi:hypothetical protein
MLSLSADASFHYEAAELSEPIGVTHASGSSSWRAWGPQPDLAEA